MSEFKIWCNYHKTWEIHEMALLPSGDLIDLKTHKISNKDHILVRYTGFKDKNGKKIYQDDLLEETNVYGKLIVKVFWSETRGTWCVTNVWAEHKFGLMSGDLLLSFVLRLNEQKIIGNKYENPELLKELQDEKTNE